MTFLGILENYYTLKNLSKMKYLHFRVSYLSTIDICTKTVNFDFKRKNDFEEHNNP